MIALMTAALIASSPSSALNVDAPLAAVCDRQIARAIAGAALSTVGLGCWLVGPLWLGLADAEVQQHVGVADQATPLADDAADHRRYQAEVFAFPRDWRSELRSAPAASLRMRFIEVLFEQGRVVRIANDPGVRVQGSKCDRTARPTDLVSALPADFRPFTVFAGVRVGDGVGRLPRLFGRAPDANRSRDWRSYLPTPLTFSDDPDTDRITGFAIATDPAAVTREAPVDIVLERDPKRCRITDVTFRNGPPRAG